MPERILNQDKSAVIARIFTGSAFPHSLARLLNGLPKAAIGAAAANSHFVRIPAPWTFIRATEGASKADRELCVRCRTLANLAICRLPVTDDLIESAPVNSLVSGYLGDMVESW